MQSTTTLDQLPLELLDIIMEKSFLHRIAISSPDKKNEDVVKALASVDFCWFQRITRRMVKRRIWPQLKGVIKVKVPIRGEKDIGLMSIDTQKLHEKLEDLRNRTKPRSHQTDKIISQLKKEGIEILNSQFDRRTLVVWIWCRSQSGLEKKLYESKRLIDDLYGLADNQPSTSEIIQSKLVIIDSNQFKKTVVACTPSARFAKRIDRRDLKIENIKVKEVAKLRDELLIFLSDPLASDVFLVFEDRNPFRLKWKIDIPEIGIIQYVASSVKENCLYVYDAVEKCVWKITRKTNGQHKKMIKWFNIDDRFTRIINLCVINDGVLLIVEDESFKSTLMIYGSDAKLIRSIQLPTDIEEPLKAVETFIGNFIVFFRFEDNLRESHSREPTGMTYMYGLCELTRDGQMVVSRFNPSNEKQKLSPMCSLFLDSDDRLFVADCFNERVVLLDSDLKWNRILVPTKEEKEEQKIRRPNKLCYDEKKMQLIVGGYGPRATAQVNVYTLNWN